MFEKEAEEYIDKLTKDWSDGEYSFSVEELRQAILHFAEFGYNKANEWHYFDKECLHEDKYKVLVQYVNGDYDIDFNFAGIWRGTSGNELRGVYAWKEIVLPELPKESE